MKTPIFFLLFIFLNVVSAQKSNNLTNYLSHIKSLEFDMAKSSAEDLKGYFETGNLILYATILENAGQIKSQEYYEGKISSNRVHEVDELIATLIGCTLDIYYRNSSKATFSRLTEVLDKSISLKQRELTKQVLLTILNYYKNDLVQINKDYEYFLQKYRSILGDAVDWGFFSINNFLLQSKNDDAISEEFYSSVQLMDSVFGLKESNLLKLRPLYHFEKGIFYEIIGNNDSASKEYELVLDLAGNRPYYRYVNYGSYLKLSEIASNKGYYLDALKLLERTKDYIDKSLPIQSEYYYYKYGSRYLEGLRRYEKALSYLKKSEELEIELRKNESILKRTQAQVEYETKEIGYQLQIQKEQSKANRNWLIAATLALVLGAGIFILIQKNTAKKRQLAEQEALLKQQRVDNLLKEQELISIDAMIEGQEKERQKVAGELHDDLGSLMATIKLHFDNVQASAQDPSLQNAQKLLDEAYQRIRGMARSKNSGVMSDQGLLPAIKKMAKTISESNALHVSVEDFGMGERMENSLELSIFRMIQELVANAIKHAEATKVNIQLTQHEDNLNIILEDNGKGFDRSKLDSGNSGMGLTNIEKRVEHLEGNFTVDSVLGKGTSILIDIPV